jgi:hypothetical protein
MGKLKCFREKLPVSTSCRSRRYFVDEHFGLHQKDPLVVHHAARQISSPTKEKIPRSEFQAPEMLIFKMEIAKSKHPEGKKKIFSERQTPPHTL